MPNKNFQNTLELDKNNENHLWEDSVKFKAAVAFLLNSQGSCQAGRPLSTFPVSVRTSMLNISNKTQAMMLRVTVTRQLAEMDRSHFDFLKTLALMVLLSLPSHQLCSFNF